MNTQNNSIMLHFDLATLTEEKTIEKICKKLLVNLFSRGNQNAYDIYTTRNNGIVTLEDLTQEMFLFLMEHENEWFLLRSSCRFSTDDKHNKLVFTSEETSKQFFRIVSQTLYNNIRRHENKKLWIEIDGEEVKIDDISTLASHVCIDDVLTLAMYEEFTAYLKECKPKKADRYIKSMELRLQGFKYQEISAILGVKLPSIKVDFYELKTLWKNFQ